MERILDAAELATPEGRARAADAALVAVAEHPDNLVRDQYLMQVAERCRLEPHLLRERLEQLRRDGPASRPAPLRGAGRPAPGSERRGNGAVGARPRAVPEEPWVREPDADGDWDADGFDGGGTELNGARADRARGRGGARSTGAPGRSDPRVPPGLEALRLAIHRPEEVADRLEAALFRDELQRAAFDVLAGADTEPLHQVIDEAPPEVRALLVRLTVEEPMGQPDEVVLQLVRDAARGELHRDHRRGPDVVGRPWPRRPRWRRGSRSWTIRRLGAATARLVAWLVVRAQTNSAGRRIVIARQVVSPPGQVASPPAVTAPETIDSPPVPSAPPSGGVLDVLPADQFDALIRMGRARGGLTQDDVMTVLRSVELSADLIADVVDRIRQAGIEFTYDTGETTVVPMSRAVADDLSGRLHDELADAPRRRAPSPPPSRRGVRVRPVIRLGRTVTVASAPEPWTSLSEPRHRRPGQPRRSGRPVGRQPGTATPTPTASGARRPTRCTCT